MIRVVLADDQALIRMGLRLLLDTTEDIKVVAEAQDGGHAVALVREHAPDVVVMDIRMPGVDGLTATQIIGRDPSLAQTRVVVLTTYGQDANVFAALRAGASGFLLKDAEPEELLRALRVAARGDALLSPEVTRQVIGAFAKIRDNAPPDSSAPGLDVLTDREREVVRLAARGLSNAEIAVHLGVSPLTVKTHVTRSMGKLDLRDRTQLVIAAYESGLVTPGR
jgi:DNA-binding NarL/FixJ family response regulator